MYLGEDAGLAGYDECRYMHMCNMHLSLSFSLSLILSSLSLSLSQYVLV
jgi:hypothetical protein